MSKAIFPPSKKNIKQAARWHKIEEELKHWSSVKKENRKPLWKFWKWIHLDLYIDKNHVIPLLSEQDRFLRSKVIVDIYAERKLK